MALRTLEIVRKSFYSGRALVDLMNYFSKDPALEVLVLSSVDKEAQTRIYRLANKSTSLVSPDLP